VAVPFLVLEDWRASPRRVPTAARDVGTVGAALLVGGWLVPHGWAWTDTVLHTPATGREWWTPTTLLAEIGAGIGHVLGLAVTTSDLIGITRSVGLLATAALLTWLLFRRDDVLLRIGAGTTLLAVLGFVLYPWYLLWGWPLLVVAGRRRLAMTASTVACCFTLANLWPQQREVAALWRAAQHSPALTIGILLILVAGGGGAVTARRRSGAQGSGTQGSQQPAGTDRVAAGVGDVEHHPSVAVDDAPREPADRAAQGQGRTPPQP
jgi:alpha-1,6-mannosyltransferase